VTGPRTRLTHARERVRLWTVPILAVLLACTMLLWSCGATRPATPGILSGAVVSGYGYPPLDVPGGMGGVLADPWPQPHVTVMVKATSGAEAGRTMADVRTDGKGNFRVALPPGRYSVYESKWPGFAVSVTVRAGQSTTTQIVGPTT
jgi:hypothetical protein